MGSESEEVLNILPEARMYTWFPLGVDLLLLLSLLLYAGTRRKENTIFAFFFLWGF